jgi:phosphatidylglycerophosphatase A
VPPGFDSPAAHASRRGLVPSAGPGSRLALFLSTGLGAGYGPVMPGTYGSALGVGLYIALAHFASPLPHPRMLLALFAAAFALFSIWVVSIALRGFTVKDPQEIVLDEVAGQLLTLVPLPLAYASPRSHWLAVFAGFLLFRLFDAAKPYPIWKFERLPGAWGVVVDDLAAGLLAAVVLVALNWLGWKM